MSTFNRHKLSLLAAAVACLGAMSGAQAATLTCGPNAPGVRINTANKADWSTDARYVAPLADLRKMLGMRPVVAGSCHPFGCARNRPCWWLQLTLCRRMLCAGQHPTFETAGAGSP